MGSCANDKPQIFFKRVKVEFKKAAGFVGVKLCNFDINFLNFVTIFIYSILSFAALINKLR